MSYEIVSDPNTAVDESNDTSATRDDLIAAAEAAMAGEQDAAPT